MAAEEAQEVGREGVMKVKQYLESTTYLRMPWTAYDHANICRLHRLDGTKKLYDLRGHFLGEKRQPLYVESKKYTTVGSQGKYYREFLADVYSHTARKCADEMDDESEFMWITWHPFSQKDWPRLSHHEYIRDAVLEFPGVLGLSPEEDPQDAVDEELCRTISTRLWMIVISDRQYELVLSPEEVRTALLHLDRPGA